MEEQDQLYFQNLSAPSKKIIYMIKNALDKKNCRFEQHFRQIQRSKTQFIGKCDFIPLMKQCSKQIPSQAIYAFYDELVKGRTEKLIQFATFQNIINSARREDSIRREIIIENEIVDLFQRSQQLNQILYVFGREGRDRLSKNSLHELFLRLNCTDDQKRQIYISSLLSGRDFIDMKDFIRQIQKKISQRRRPIKDLSQLDKLKQKIEDQKLEKLYFNPQSVYNSNLKSKVIKYLKSKQIFKDEKNPTYESNKLICLAGKEEYYLFQKGQKQLCDKSKLKNCILSKHVVQGNVKSCYLHGALSALALKYPQLIYRLFILFNNPSHMYAVTLFIDGDWQTIQLDTQFPINDERDFCGVQWHEQRIWVMLLEKAYAKINESYDNINGGSNQEGTQIFTGGTSISISTQKKEKQQYFLPRVEQSLKNGSILTCHRNCQFPEQSKQFNKMGLVQHHSYGILGIFTDKNIFGEEITLIKLRNPWGDARWKGPWSISSNLWTQQLRQKLKYRLNPKDGTFYMSKKDFVHYFKEINICRINEINKNSCRNIQCKNNQFSAISITIRKQGSYSFATYLKNRRKLQRKYLKTNYQRWSWMFLFEIKDGKIEKICSNYCKDGNNVIQKDGELKEGNYVIILMISWSHEDQQQYRLTSYGPEQVIIASRQYRQKFLQQYIGRNCNECIVYSSFCDNKNILEKHKFFNDFGYGYVEIDNQERYGIMVQIQFNMQQKNITFIGENKCPRKLSVNPKQKINLKFIYKSTEKEPQIKIYYQSLEDSTIRGQSRFI